MSRSVRTTSGMPMSFTRGTVTRKVRFYDMEVAVKPEVAHTDAHAGLDHAVLAQRDAVLQSLLGKRAVVIVAEEEARGRVPGDIDVGPAVVIEVGRDRSESVPAVRLPDPRLLA